VPWAFQHSAWVGRDRSIHWSRPKRNTTRVEMRALPRLPRQFRRGAAFAHCELRRYNGRVSTYSRLLWDQRTTAHYRCLVRVNFWSSNWSWTKDSDPILRNYSMSGPPGTERYRISVKRAAGAGSRYFHDRVRVGGLLQVSAPRGSFTLAPSDRPLVLLSGGIGVTPVLSMLHSHADSAANSMREVWWCYGTRSGTEQPFAAEARALLNGLSHSHSFVAYSKPEDGDQSGKYYDVSGGLSLSSLQQFQVPKEADFYLCGPPAFLRDFTTDLKSWGVPDSCIHSEVFGAGPSLTPGIASTASVSPHPPAESVGAGPKVSFTRSGLTVPWDSQYGSLLEFAEACDIPVRWSCRMGVCHTCESGLIDGAITYASEPLALPAEGNVLICCSTPQTAVELDL
jgi:ferredoxin-NADP reductase